MAPDRGPGGARAQQPVGATVAGAASRTRSIGEELLSEAGRPDGLGLTLRAVAETLLEQTRYANARSAEMSLRRQFKRRGSPLRSGTKAQRARQARSRDERARAA